MSVRKRVLQGLERAVLRAKAFGIGWDELVSLLRLMWRKNRMTVDSAPGRERKVIIRGWQFTRMESGMVGIRKESLVHDDILLGEDEWDQVVSQLWQPPSQEDLDAIV